MTEFSTAVIGGGPGGYVAAIRLHQAGIGTAVFEHSRLGGVCLNWGCIPTKALVKIGDLYSEIRKADEFGIVVGNSRPDFKAIMKRKDQVVEDLVSGVEFLFRKRKIPVVNERVLKISKTSEGYQIFTGSEEYRSKNIIIATGSAPKELPDIKTDGRKIMSSRDLLASAELPGSLVVIGGGVIGCEFASLFANLGVKTEIVEFLPSLINQEDAEVSRRLQLAFRKRGIEVHLKKSVKGIREESGKLVLSLSDGKYLETDKVLLSVGRNPVFGIECEGFTLAMDRGFVLTDDDFRTSEPGIYAVGDVTGKQMLAHTASKQGEVAAATIVALERGNYQKSEPLCYENIPRCTFTDPEIASVGFTEAEAMERYGKIDIGRFPFTANGKALSLGMTFGFVKTISAGENKRLVGMHIIGPGATELIAQGSIMLGMKLAAEDLEKFVYAHPTLSEAVREALEDLNGASIHKI
ncbi:MAG: dihydrolipoyl dehydrogenase [Candidatus Cloacimonetes bacterium]|nr:dihydrolipoyl dehydrogenase [Candidatus Cloacimonadota bacterium]